MCYPHCLGWVNIQLVMIIFLALRTSHALHMSTFKIFQICKHPQSLFQSRPCCYSQSVSHLQPFYLCHHSLQIQVRVIIPKTHKIIILQFPDMSKFSNRDTLAEKVPCLHFLSQAPRRDCMSASHSDSSFRDSVLSRQSSVSKTKFHRVSSMSTTETVSQVSAFTFEE